MADKIVHLIKEYDQRSEAHFTAKRQKYLNGGIQQEVRDQFIRDLAFIVSNWDRPRFWCSTSLKEGQDEMDRMLEEYNQASHEYEYFYDKPELLAIRRKKDPTTGDDIKKYTADWVVAELLKKELPLDYIIVDREALKTKLKAFIRERFEAEKQNFIEWFEKYPDQWSKLPDCAIDVPKPHDFTKPQLVFAIRDINSELPMETRTECVQEVLDEMNKEGAYYEYCIYADHETSYSIGIREKS
jgi:hypothetical protein